MRISAQTLPNPKQSVLNLCRVSVSLPLQESAVRPKNWDTKALKGLCDVVRASEFQHVRLETTSKGIRAGLEISLAEVLEVASNLASGDRSMIVTVCTNDLNQPEAHI